MASTFTVHVHHGGVLVDKPDGSVSYEGGIENIWDKVDPDFLSFFEFQSMLEEIGIVYNNITGAYYLKPGYTMGEGLRRVYADVEILELCDEALRAGSIHVFVAHTVDKPEEINILDIEFDKPPGPSQPTQEDPHNAYSSPTHSTQHDIPTSPTPNQCQNSPIHPQTAPNQPQTGPIQGHIGTNQAQKQPRKGAQERKKHAVRKGTMMPETHTLTIEEDNGDHHPFDVFEDMMDNACHMEDFMDEEDMESSDEEWMASRKTLNDERLIESIRRYKSGFNGGSSTAMTCFSEEDSDEDDESWNSEYEESENEYSTPPGSDEEVDETPKSTKKLKVGMHTDFKTLVWAVGMKFESAEFFKDMVNRYAVVAGYNIRWTRNYKMKKLAAKCKEGCSWYLYASWSGDKSSFVVKSVNPKHTCSRQDFENKQCKPKWLAKEFLMQYKQDSNWSKKALAKAVMEKFGVKLENWACYRVKKEAHKLLHGSLEDHYMKVGSYLKALLTNDPGTHVDLQTVDSEKKGEPVIFHRLYISLSGVRKGFISSCRPVLCVDGCFLKTFLGGQLLVAVARDGNNQMFPVCWAVVESENNDSWFWFLENLKKDLGGFEVDGATIISDQHLGIVNAVQQLFPHVEHRLCARHIYAKWAKKHKGPGLKNGFYKVVKATSMAAYEVALQELSVLSSDAAADLSREQPKRFCRAFMRTTSKCELVVNNLAETFNGWILDSRSKPLIDMLEEIRVHLMARMFNKKRWMQKATDTICPRVRTKLEKNKEYARGCTVVASNDMEFQVFHGIDMLVVNLGEGTCSCKWWDHHGIPCCHAVACCNWVRVPPEQYVHKWLTVGCYLSSYKDGIKPIQGEQDWEKVDFPLQPPPLKKGAGRPRRVRRKDPTEKEIDKDKTKLTKHGGVMTCSICQGKNHNKRSCPKKSQQPENANSSIQTEKRGRTKRNDANKGQQNSTNKANKSGSTKGNQAETSTTRGRGRPRKETNNILHEQVPRGVGIFMSLQNSNVHMNPGQKGATVLTRARAQQLQQQ